MKVTIVYSNPSGDKSLSEIYQKTVAAWSAEHEIAGIFKLAEHDLKFCTGCWSCWWKTPGLCSINDGIANIYRSIMRSDLLLFIAPLKMGTVSAELKLLIERMIPLIHPYMAIVDGEVHHSMRYEKYPEIAAFLLEEKDTDDEDRNINTEYFSRLVKNFYSKVRFIDFYRLDSTEGTIEIPVA